MRTNIVLNEKLVREAMALYPDHPAARPAQVLLLRRSRVFRDAMTAGQQALAAGRWEAAESEFSRAHALDPRAPGAVRAWEMSL